MEVGYPTVSVNSGVRTSPESAGSRGRRQNGTSSTDGSIAFDAVLAATSSMTADSVANRGFFSAEQMFEPATTDAHERGQSQLKADDRDGRLPSAADERRDVTSIEARRAARSALGRDVAQGNSGSSTVAGMRGELKPLPAEPNELSTSSASGEKNAATPLSSLRAGAFPSERLSQQAVPISNGRSNGGDLPPVFAQATSIATEATPMASAGPAQTGGQTSGHAAQQVAEILAAGRIGQADSARAVTSSAGAHLLGEGSDNPKGMPGMAARSAGTEANAKPSNESAVTVRSDFDRLVRSVRMKIGPRQSSARLHLEPPQLGRVQVDVRMKGGQLEIGVRTETIDARNLLAQRAAALRSALEHCGIHVERFEIIVDSFDEKPADFESAGDADVASHSGQEEPLPGSQAKSNNPDARGTAVTIEPEGEQVAAVVAETRLDIRA